MIGENVTPVVKIAQIAQEYTSHCWTLA